MGIFTSSKVTIGIATAVTATPADAAAYGALTYTNIGFVENPGDIGDQFQDVTFDELGNGRTIHLKGQVDGGTMQIVVGRDDTDAGQTALIAASDDDSTADYPFKITYPNKQNATGTGAIRYFTGKVMGKRETVGGANNVVRMTTSVGITSPIVSVASTAGV